MFIRKSTGIMRKIEQEIDFNSYSFAYIKKQEGDQEMQSQPFARKKNKSKIISSMKEVKNITSPIQTLNKLRQWRQNNIAPVDVVGCERTFDQNESKEIQRYQILVALMLSVQTKDETTAMIMKRLVKFGLKPHIISKLTENQLLSMISESNFNRRKAKNILQMSKIVLESGMPRNSGQLMKFAGVGTKISMIYMRVAEGVNQGIGVDTHVHRISNRLGWVDTVNPNQTEEQLQKIFHKQQWEGMNIAMVGFGQTLCEAKKPKCNQCPLAQECPSYRPLF